MAGRGGETEGGGVMLKLDEWPCYERSQWLTWEEPGIEEIEAWIAEQVAIGAQRRCCCVHSLPACSGCGAQV